MHTSLVVGRIGGSSAIDDTQSANAIRVHGLATAIHQGIAGVNVRVGAVGWGVGVRVTSRVAVAIGVGHARSQGG